MIVASMPAREVFSAVAEKDRPWLASEFQFILGFFAVRRAQESLHPLNPVLPWPDS